MCAAGKQFKVRPTDIIVCDKLNAFVGDKIRLEKVSNEHVSVSVNLQVLLVGSSTFTAFGTPLMKCVFVVIVCLFFVVLGVDNVAGSSVVTAVDFDFCCCCCCCCSFDLYYKGRVNKCCRVHEWTTMGCADLL